MNVAIYARVSTTDQDASRQLAELREYCERRRWDVVDEYVDTGWSGSKSSRPQLDRCMADARKHAFDLVIVWALDRWGRSVAHLLESVEKLRGYGVGWLSFSQNLDMSTTNPTASLLLTILGAIAQFERELIRERTKSGQLHYRRAWSEKKVGKGAGLRQSRSGKNLAVGRPKRIFRRDEAARLRKKGLSWRAIAAQLGVPAATIRLALAPKGSK